VKLNKNDGLGGSGEPDLGLGMERVKLGEKGGTVGEARVDEEKVRTERRDDYGIVVPVQRSGDLQRDIIKVPKKKK